MDEIAVLEQEAPARLNRDEAEQLVLRTIAAHAESLLRTAQRHSLCLDDAHDAYQRGLEIFMRRAPTLDPTYVGRWLHVVVKHEAIEVRRGRTEHVADEEVDYERQEALHVSSPEERVLDGERATRAAEALQRVKPQELRAMWLKALGNSYDEIARSTGWSATKVNRCLAEGRKRFLDRFEGIEAGEECRRWHPVLSAMVDGEATAAQISDARPHLRNCPACRATLKGLRETDRSFALVLPVGLVTAGVRLSNLVERLMPAATSADGAAGAGGVTMLGVGGAKLAGLLAAGAAATAGGGLVVATEHHPSPHRHAVVHHVKQATAAVVRSPVSASPPTAASGPARPVHRPASAGHHPARRLVARLDARTARIEFAPAGSEPVDGPPPSQAPAPVGAASTPTARTVPPQPVSTPPASADAIRGEFAPQP
jgi:RNA polymerase sigma factor (sigma-70 family)